MERLTRRVAWTSAAIHGLVHASVMLLPAVMGDLQRAFGVSLLQVAVAANLMYLAFGMAAIPAGLLADRVGSRTMLIVASLGCAGSLFAISLAPSFSWLIAGLVALGLSTGIYHPSGLSMLSRGIARHEHGRAIGIHGAGGNLGEALAPTFAALMAAQFSWRYGFAVAGLIALVSGALTLTLPVAFGASEAGHTHGGHAALPPLSGLGAALRGMWSSPPLRWMLVGTVAGGLVYRGVLTFLPLHLADSAGSTFNASFLTSLVLLAGMAAQRFGGELADRLPRERLFLAEMALFAPVMVLLGLVSGTGLIALALGFGFLWYMAQPLATAMTAAYADSRDHGLFFGIQFAATFGVGSFATTLGGVLIQRGGTSLAFLGFGAIAMVQLVAALAMVHAVRAQSAPTTVRIAP